MTTLHIDLMTSDFIPAHQAGSDATLRKALVEYSPSVGNGTATNLVRFMHELHYCGEAPYGMIKVDFAVEDLINAFNAAKRA